LWESLNVRSIKTDPFLIDDKPQIGDKSLAKGGFVFLDLKVIDTQQLEYGAHMLYMFFPGITEDQSVIQINDKNVAQQTTKYIINESLECGRGISEAKRHNYPFIKPKSSLKSCF